MMLQESRTSYALYLACLPLIWLWYGLVTAFFWCRSLFCRSHEWQEMTHFAERCTRCGAERIKH